MVGRTKHIHVQVRQDGPRDDIKVSEDSHGLFCSMYSPSSRISLAQDALDGMRRDLTKNRESSGFLLGAVAEKRGKAVFTNYSTCKGVIGNKDGLEFDVERMLEQLKGFKRAGFDSVIDIHNHPYTPDELKVSIQEKIRDTPLPALFELGLFRRLQDRCGVSGPDAKFYHEWSVTSAGLGFKRYYLGILATLRIEESMKKLSVLMMFGGKALKPVPLEVHDVQARTLSAAIQTKMLMRDDLDPGIARPWMAFP
jgi:hypothetical protein